eukprot:4507797-Alexandrium_andersonii.AAC.1
MLDGSPEVPLSLGRHLAPRGRAGVRGPAVGRSRLPPATGRGTRARQARPLPQLVRPGRAA